MKQAKDRVIAIDYFRGLFIIMVVVNHAMLFSLPFAYLTGAGRMWTSAAELLLLISGLTFGIVRGHQIKSDFLTVYKKTLRRAGQIYLVNVLVVALSLLLAVYAVSHNLVNYVYGTMPSTSGLHLLRSILSFSYSIGSAGFLGVFAVLLLAAPPLLYVLSTRLWPSVPILSAAIFLFTTHGAGSSIPYSWLGQWQIYFILGLLMAKFRVGLLSYFYNLKDKSRRAVSAAIMSASFITLAACLLFEYSGSLYPALSRLAAAGWLPVKLQTAYQHLLALKPSIDNLLMDSRMGLLRPVFALLVLASLYLIYQQYKSLILRKTGRTVIAMGKETLWIFVGQALVIPLLSMIPLQRNNMLNNTALTAVLLAVMWLITKRRAVKPALQAYAAELSYSYNTAKYDYLQRFETEET